VAVAELSCLCDKRSQLVRRPVKSRFTVCLKAQFGC
jgi:hypothetical protein